MTSNFSAGQAPLTEKALLLIRWQPRQWQAPVKIGGPDRRKRTRSQRHPPSAVPGASVMPPA
jgi:hypothetical protein